MLSWIIFYASAVILVCVFAHGVWHKCVARSDFARAVVAYQLLPVSVAVRSPLPFAGVELVAIAEIVLSRGHSRYGALLLLVLYTLAMVINLARGRTDLDCGCGGAATPLSGWLVARNGVLILCALPQILPGVLLVGSGMLFAIALVAFAAGAFIVLYAAMNQLLANRAAKTQ